MDILQQILTKYWGFKDYRPLQLDVINAVMEEKDTLALFPTGGGKSICYQVPALAKDGLCIVISPLIALMNDQVDGLKKKGIPAIAITSAMQKREVDIALDNCIYGKIKLLYISPERIGSELFQERVKKMKVSLIAVDEAHCISQWGYDFRPSYLKIDTLRELIPETPVLALTATATTEVITDIQEKLKFKKENLIRKSFERKNVALMVLQEEDKTKRLLKIVNHVKGSGIVYVRNRRKTVEVAGFLKKNNISADFYHAGLDFKTRQTKQEEWMEMKTRIIVSTNAFGMGIDKADVRVVVHLDLPDSLEAYFQEAGRAGRDEKKSYAVLLTNNGDRIDLEHNIELNFPGIEEIKQIYQCLANYYQLAVGSGKDVSFEFDIADFCNRYNLKALMVFNSLKFLEKEEYIQTTESLYQPSRLHINVNKEELYKFQIVNPLYDDFIKMLLRSYGGTFDNYVPINESDLAQRTGKSKKEISQLLNVLQQNQLISYIPQTSLPQITYLRERQEVKNIFISPENLALVKKRALEKMQWVIQYAGNTHKCRSQVLLSYFGENNTYRCGICDVCLERNKLELSSLEFENISNKIKQTLILQSMPLTDLINSIAEFKENDALKVTQWLIDNSKIKYDSDHNLHWKK